MQHRSLSAFLAGQATPQALWLEIEEEVGACNVAAEATETSHVIIDDGPAISVDGNQVDRLLQALESGALPLPSGAYIADALIFSDDFLWDDEAVGEVIFALSDESRPLTAAEVARLRRRLIVG